MPIDVSDIAQAAPEELTAIPDSKSSAVDVSDLATRQSPEASGLLKTFAKAAVAPFKSAVLGAQLPIRSKSDLAVMLAREYAAQKSTAPGGVGNKLAGIAGGLAGGVGEFIGAEAAGTTLAAETGPAAPFIGLGAAATAFGASGAGESFKSAGFRALDEGKSLDEAVAIGMKVAKVGAGVGAVSAVALPGVVSGTLTKAAALTAARSGAPATAAALTESALATAGKQALGGAAVGAGGQIAQNVAEQQAGLKTGTFEGVGGQAAIMGGLPLLLHARSLYAQARSAGAKPEVQQAAKEQADQAVKNILLLPELSDSTKRDKFNLPQTMDPIQPVPGDSPATIERKIKAAVNILRTTEAPEPQKRPAQAKPAVIGATIEPVKPKLFLPPEHIHNLVERAFLLRRMDDLQREFSAADPDDGPALAKLQKEHVDLLQALRGNEAEQETQPQGELEGTYPPTAEQLGTFQSKGRLNPTGSSDTTYGGKPGQEALPKAGRQQPQPLQSAASRFFKVYGYAAPKPEGAEPGVLKSAEDLIAQQEAAKRQTLLNKSVEPKKPAGLLPPPSEEPPTDQGGPGPATPGPAAPGPAKEREGLLQKQSRLYSGLGASLNDWLGSATKEQVMEKYQLASEMGPDIDAEIAYRKQHGEDFKALNPLRYDVDHLRSVMEHKLMTDFKPEEKGPANAVQPESPQLLRPVSEQPGKGPEEVPAPGDSQETNEGGGKETEAEVTSGEPAQPETGKVPEPTTQPPTGPVAGSASPAGDTAGGPAITEPTATSTVTQEAKTKLKEARDTTQAAFEKLGAAERGAYDNSKRKGMTKAQLGKLAEFDKLVAAERLAKEEARESFKDKFTRDHFEEWLKKNVPPAEQESVRAQVTRQLKVDPGQVDTKGWPDIAELGKRNFPGEGKPAQSKTPAKAAAKVEAEIDKTAQIGGQAPAKAVKAELLKRIEDATHGAPEELAYNEGKHGFVKINIPGDGDFTIPRHLAALSEMRDRVRKIPTDSGKPAKLRVPSVTTDTDKLKDQALQIYGDPRKAIAALESQLGNEGFLKDADYDPSQVNALKRVVELLRGNLPENIRQEKIDRLKDRASQTEDSIRAHEASKAKLLAKKGKLTNRQQIDLNQTNRRIEDAQGVLSKQRTELSGLLDEAAKDPNARPQEQTKAQPEAEPTKPAGGISVGPGAASPEDFPRYSAMHELTKDIASKGQLSPDAPFADRLKEYLRWADRWAQGKESIIGSMARSRIAGKALLDAYLHLPKWTNFLDAVGKWTGANQATGLEVRRFQHAILKAIPQKIRQEAVTNYIQADGNEALLRERAQTSGPATRRGYETALTLTQGEKELARQIQSYFESKLQEGIDAGILHSAVEDYVTQIWKKPNQNTNRLVADLSGFGGELNPSFKFARKRIFESYFEGEQAGFTPANKSIGNLLSVYDLAFNRAISARGLIKSLHEGLAADGLPITAISQPTIKEVPDKDGGEYPGAYLVQANVVPKDAVTKDGRSYLPVDHWALKDWKFLIRGEKGGNEAPVLSQGDMWVHPDHFNALNNALKRSSLRDNPVARTLLKASAFAKQTKLSLSLFHLDQEGIHALFHRIDPTGLVKKLHGLDLNEPTQRGLVEHGLMVSDPHAMELFSEGSTGGGLVSKIPGVAQAQNWFNEFLFKDYIPKLKMNMALDALERNRKAYANDLASGKITDDQLQALSARESNAAFGEQNYKLMGRDPTRQDWFRLTMLAPDFLESRFRFVAQALKPYGREQRIALGFMAGTLYVGSRLLNAYLNDGDGKWTDYKHPFSVFHKGKEYRLRTVLGDVAHLLTDPRAFAMNRLSPATRSITELATGRDDRGIKRGSAEQLVDLASWFKPIPSDILNVPGFKGRSDMTRGQTALTSLGVSSRSYGPQQQLYELVDKFMEKSKDPMVQERYDRLEKEAHVDSPYRPLRDALKKGDVAVAKKAYDQLRATGRKPDVIERTLRVVRPFTGSQATEAKFKKTLSPEHLKLYEEAVKDRKDTYLRFQQMLRNN